MRRTSWLLILVFVGSALYAQSPATVNNDDSCDVIVTPAATLLLPYFEVDLTRPDGETTLFTITNVTQLPQIAHVTLWTDWSFPALSYNIFLTGYDVQSINVYDVLARGLMSGPDGTTTDSEEGDRSIDNDENPLLDVRDCDNLAVVIPPPFLPDIRAAFIAGGDVPFRRCPDGPIGGAHERAIGYVTIDVVANCDFLLPTDAAYFPSHLLYDNVLTGDYQQVSPQENASQGGPMVHIRAIPEGGRAMQPTNFTTTFYGNLQSGGTTDRRQPLPAIFAARWISAADGDLKTSFKIWREGVTRGDPGCAVASNGSLTVADIVRFDEDENPVSFSDCQNCGVPTGPLLPATSNRSSDDSVFPPNPDGAAAGWMYMNLNNQGVFPFRPFAVASQNWVVVSMEAEGRFSADFDAAPLGNGCTPSIPSTGDGETVIAPAANLIEPAFAGGSPATVNNDDSCDIRVAPAATLLLPYFEVDLANPAGQTTLFTITNVAPLPQIARVTLWTDRAYPILTFNIFLTGYDVQPINLYDVLAHGRIAPPGTSSDSVVGRRSAGNDANPLLDTADCENLLEQLPPQFLGDLRNALTVGVTSACANARIGSLHGHAIGYATIDVVRNCGSASPADPGYFSTEILYDNVLIGDYQQVDRANNSAQGNTLVHIRAIPEGGTSATAATNFRRTFYSRLQNGGTADRRQPLPSTFAARWIHGGAGDFNTSVTIWRESQTDAAAGCAVSANAQMIGELDLVRFDEEENATQWNYGCTILCPEPAFDIGITGRHVVDDRGEIIPPNPQSDQAGWIYFNLGYHARNLSRGLATQAWVTVAMTSEGRYSVEADATPLGNGCSPQAGVTAENGSDPAIGPAPNINQGRSPNP